MNRLTELLGIDKPIFQAPIGSIAGPVLCTAVSEAGGLGAMGVTWTPTETLLENIRRVKECTEKPFQINFVLHFDPVGLEAAVAEGVPVVTFSWGDPSPYIELVKSSGAKVGAQVGSIEGAQFMAKLGLDFIVVQGVEAGGHVQAHDALLTTLPQAVPRCPETPIAAAGGLSNREDVRSVLDAGAEAAMLGTRFVACAESEAHSTYKRALVEAGEGDTVLTNCYDGGWPGALHRVLRNVTFAAWEAAGCPNAGRRPGEGEPIARSADGSAIELYGISAPKHDTTGKIEAMCLYAGAGVGQVTDCPTASDIVDRLWP